jgi:hypothetical protein
MTTSWMLSPRLRTCFGGNVKALLAEHVGITLPEVSRQVPPGEGGGGAGEALFAWRGRPLVIALYTI